MQDTKLVVRLPNWIGDTLMTYPMLLALQNRGVDFICVGFVGKDGDEMFTIKGRNKNCQFLMEKAKNMRFCSFTMTLCQVKRFGWGKL